MDALDIKLLQMLQNDGKRSIAELAELVGLSNSACAKRVARFWSEGLIKKQVARLDRTKFRRPVTAAVMVSLSYPKSTVSDRFAKDIAGFENVLQCHAVTGDFDYLLLVVGQSIEEYHEFAQATFGSMETVKSYKTTFVLRTVKNEDIVPVYCLDRH